MPNTVDLAFADGSYTFALPIARINELQSKTGIGIGALFNRVLKGVARVGDQIVLAPSAAEFYLADIYETVRQGLIGGGRGIVDDQEVIVTPAVAERLMKNYVLPESGQPLRDAWSMAAAILGACVVGFDEPKKKDGASEETTPEPILTDA